MVSMRRALLLVAAVVLLPMAAACGGSKSTERQSEEPSQATATTEAAVEEGEGGAAPGPQEFSPLGLLTGDLPGLGGGPAGLKVNQDVDPSLAAALLRKEDLPGAFGSLAGGQFSFSVPSEDGDVNMAMSLFFSGDPAAGAEGPAAAVISAAAAMPPDLLKKSLASFPSGQGSEDEIRAALSRAEKISGLKFLDMGILDASGLGEESAGLHVVMDFGRFGVVSARVT